MKLFSRFQNLFVPREEEEPRRKVVKKTKKKVKKKVKIKSKKKTLKKKKVLKKRKKVVKKGALKRKIKKKVKKKVVKKKIRPKIKKKPAKKRQPKKIKKKSVAPLKRFLEEKEVGVITHYFGKISVGIIKLKSTLRVGETIHIKGAHDDFSQTVRSMQINHKDVSMAGKGSEIGIKVPQPVHENDRVYKL